MTTLAFEPRGLVVLEGAASVFDRVVRRLKFFQGEWIFNELLGVSYQEFFDSQGERLDLLRSQALEVDGVNDIEIDVINFDAPSRTIDLRLTVFTDFGTAADTVQI